MDVEFMVCLAVIRPLAFFVDVPGREEDADNTL